MHVSQWLDCGYSRGEASKCLKASEFLSFRIDHSRLQSLQHMMPGILFKSASSAWLIHYYILSENTHYLFSTVRLKQSQLFGLYLEWRGATQPPPPATIMKSLKSGILGSACHNPQLSRNSKIHGCQADFKAECLQVVRWSQFICELICSRLTKHTRCHKVSLGYQKNKTNPRIQSNAHSEGERELNIIRIITLFLAECLLFGLKL